MQQACKQSSSCFHFQVCPSRRSKTGTNRLDDKVEQLRASFSQVPTDASEHLLRQML